MVGMSDGHGYFRGGGSDSFCGDGQHGPVGGGRVESSGRVASGLYFEGWVSSVPREAIVSFWDRCWWSFVGWCPRFILGKWRTKGT